MTKLSPAQCERAMAEGEFGPELLASAPAVALVLTQSWCPQWAWMRSYLEGLPPDPAFAVFYVEYDREEFFEPFMAFKEDVLGNREIPYVRYYREGRFARESNFIDSGGFLRLLGHI
jgi:hypothetical protein